MRVFARKSKMKRAGQHMRFPSTRLVAVCAIILSAPITVTACGGDDATTAVTETIQAVSRGNIRSTVNSSGSVSFPNQKTLNFGSSGTVTKVLVTEGARVTKDQILAEIDLNDLQAAVTKAEASLLSAQQTLDDAKKTNGALDLARAQESVASAKLQLRSAQDALDEARGTAYQAELRQKQEAVANAQALLQAAKDALDKAKAPYTEQDIAKQREAVANAGQAVKLAQDAVTTAKTPYTADDLASAAATLSQAKQSVTNAQTSLTVTEATQSRLVREASDLLDTRKRPYRNAWTPLGLGVSEADIYLSPAEMYVKYPSTLPTIVDLNTLWSNLIIARDGLESARATQASSLTSAQRSVTSAQDALRTAQTNYDKVAAGVDTLDLATKQAKLTTALENSKAAQDTLTKILAGPDLVDVALKQAKVASAETTLKAVQDGLTKIVSGPFSEDIALKQAKVATAKAALADAEEKLSLVSKGPDAVTLGLRTSQVTDAQTSLTAAKDKLALAQIKSPYDGVVNVVNVKVGDTVAANTQAVLVVDTTQIEVQAVVDEADIFNIREGLPVQISLNQAPTLPLAGTVRYISLLPNRQQGIVSYNIKIAVTVPTITQIPGGAAGGRPGGAGGNVQAPGGQGSQTGTPPRDGGGAGGQVIQRPGGGAPGAQGGAGAQAGSGNAQQGAGAGRPGVPQQGAGSATSTPVTALPGGAAGGTAFGGRGAALIQSGGNPLSLLRDGLSVQSTIVVNQVTDVVMVPARALSGNAANRIVKVVKADGTREDRPVQTGLTDGTNTQIVTGLEEGEKIAVPARGGGARTTTGTGGGQQFPGGGQIFIQQPAFAPR